MNKIIRAVLGVWFLGLYVSAASAVDYVWTEGSEPPPEMSDLDRIAADAGSVPGYQPQPVLASAYHGQEKAAEEPETSLSNFIEVRGYRGGDPVIKAYFETEVAENTVAYLSAVKLRGWDEVTIGLAYYLTPELEVGLGFGASWYSAAEEAEKSTHFTVSEFGYYETDWEKNNIEASLVVEHYARDHTDPWYYEAYVEMQLGESDWSAGVFAEKYVGWGPRLSFAPRDDIKIWFVPIVGQDDYSTTTAIFGIQYLF